MPSSMHKFYSTYRIPFYLGSLLATPFLSFPILLFPVGFSFLLFLSTFWSIQIKILLTMKSNTTNPSFIYYKNKYLCKILKNNNIFYFVSKKNIYVIEKNQVVPNGKQKNNNIHNNDNHNYNNLHNNDTNNNIDKLQSCTILKLKPNTHHTFNEYKDYKNLQYTHPKYIDLLQKNDFNYIPPSFISLFIQHIIAPLFVFQIFSSLLWCLDEYPYHALFTIFMQFIFEAGVVFSRLKNLREFGTLNLKMSEVELYYRKNNQNNAGNIIKSNDILQGDVIIINQHSMQIPCDLLIIQGTCAVNEAMLTGESIPLQKESIAEKNTEFLDENKHKKHILFGGTEMIKVNEPLKCFVLKTGFDTNQGNLIKKMMDTNEISMDKEAFYFIGCLLVFAIMTSVYVVKEGISSKKDPYKLLLDVIIILTNVVPPELPMEMTIAISMALQNLLRLNIFCLEGNKIPISGKVDVCCFDKTGTLTEIRMDVSKIVVLNETGSEEYENKIIDQKNVITKHVNSTNNVLKNDDSANTKLGDNKNTNNDMSNIIPVIDIVSVCHSLIKIDKPRGDPLETSAFDFFGISLIDENNSMVNKYNNATNLNANYTAIKKYTFCSELRRMTVVAEKNNTVFVGMKGAPESVIHYLKNKPQNYDIYKKYAKQGYRIISLAIKKYKRKVEYNREDVEKELTFAGFILYECQIKKGTEESIKMLKESGHNVIMITGDNLMTAINVAEKVGIIESEDTIDDCDNNKKHNNVDNKINNYEQNNDINTQHCTTSLQNADNLYNQVGVEGEMIDNILESDDFYKFKVFARADPSHKERIIKKYKDNGKVTLMCGDGTNDVGALKIADVGVALVENKKMVKKRRVSNINDYDELTVKLGDASVAAPFTAKTGSISAVVDIIRQGRSTLVTTIQMYKILALNSLISAFSFSVLDIIGIKYGDVQMTISGVLIAFSFMFLTKSKTLNEISKKRPVDNIFNKYVIFSIILQTIIHILSFVILLKSGIRDNVVMYHNEGFGIKSGLFDASYNDHEIKVYVKENVSVNNVGSDNNVRSDNNVGSDRNNSDDKINNEVTASSSKVGEGVSERATSNKSSTNNDTPNNSKFKPSNLNSAIFILSVSQQINTFMANYIGRPFRESFFENTHLRNCLFCVSAIVVGLILEVNNSFSRLMEIVPLYNYRYVVLCVVVFDFICCYLCEKLCFYAFML